MAERDFYTQTLIGRKKPQVIELRYRTNPGRTVRGGCHVLRLWKGPSTDSEAKASHSLLGRTYGRMNTFFWKIDALFKFCLFLNADQ
ncbi:hypothetical protein Naga_100081g14 [Nannochloropsis gaditana]|uniref:Uncharacterized protein n=1 Tax=Nannochloropsis gaditana TaxID=72520 RepID=W7T1S2_9STRA|nr:hypothetical protein Naga_100081g14 [Nannochloropsis gaditana]